MGTAVTHPLPITEPMQRPGNAMPRREDGGCGMADPDSIAGPLIGVLAGMAMLAMGAFLIGIVILGGEPLTNLILPPFWILYGITAAGLILMWNYFRWRAEIMGGGARAR